MKEHFKTLRRFWWSSSLNIIARWFGKDILEMSSIRKAWVCCMTWTERLLGSRVRWRSNGKWTQWPRSNSKWKKDKRQLSSKTKSNRSSNSQVFQIGRLHKYKQKLKMDDLSSVARASYLICLPILQPMAKVALTMLSLERIRLSLLPKWISTMITWTQK